MKLRQQEYEHEHIKESLPTTSTSTSKKMYKYHSGWCVVFYYLLPYISTATTITTSDFELIYFIVKGKPVTVTRGIFPFPIDFYLDYYVTSYT